MDASRHYSAYSKNAARLLGKQIRLYRKERRWTETELAGRAGVSRATLQKIEKGDMTCKLGLVFEVAYLAGVELFQEGNDRLESKLDRINDKLLLLPKSVRKPRREIDDDF